MAGTSWRTQRARLAAAERHHPDDREVVDALRRDLRVARAEDYIKRLVDEAPPLSADVREALAVLLRGGGRVA